MTDHGEFQEQVRRLSDCIAHFEQAPGGPERDAAREIIQLLMEVHGKGLERIMEIVFEGSESGGALIDRLAKDEPRALCCCSILCIPMPLRPVCRPLWNGCGRDCANSPARLRW